MNPLLIIFLFDIRPSILTHSTDDAYVGGRVGTRNESRMVPVEGVVEARNGRQALAQMAPKGGMVESRVLAVETGHGECPREAQLR